MVQGSNRKENQDRRREMGEEQSTGLVDLIHEAWKEMFCRESGQVQGESRAGTVAECRSGLFWSSGAGRRKRLTLKTKHTMTPKVHRITNFNYGDGLVHFFLSAASPPIQGKACCARTLGEAE